MSERTKEVAAYCFSDSSRLPLLIVGKSGAGKSSVIAKCAKNAEYCAENDLLDVPDGYERWNIFYHFVGATLGSTDLAFLLQRLIKELNPDAKERIASIDALIHQTSSLLSDEASAPLLIFVDAINQLEDDKQKFIDRWLPNELAPNIKVILSMIEETPSHITLRSYKPSPRELVCGSLDDASKKEIVLSICQTFDKKLNRNQVRWLIAKRGSINPLWLTLACEELRDPISIKSVTQKIHELPDDLIDMEMKVLTRLENQAGEQLIKSALCLLEVSRHGLIEIELMALLERQKNVEWPSCNGNYDVYKTQQKKKTLKTVDDPENKKLKNKSKICALEKTYTVDEECSASSSTPEKSDTTNEHGSVLPAKDWAVIYRNLKPLLRLCGDLGTGRLDFHHRSLSKAVRQKYFTGSNEVSKLIYDYWQSALVEFFESVTDIERRAEELPYQLEKIRDDARLAKCLLEWPIFNHLFDEYFSIDLLHYWQKCGGLSLAAEMYMESLACLKPSRISDVDFSDQAHKVAVFLVQARKYEESYRILEDCVSLNMSDQSKLADAYASMAYCKSMQLNTVVFDMPYRDVVNERKNLIELCMRSNQHREDIDSEDQEYKIAKNNIELGYNLFCTGDEENGLAVTNEAIEVFEKLNDIGMLARGLLMRSWMLSGFDRKKAERIEARQLCVKAYGDNHVLYGDATFSLGSLYRDAGEYDQAYDYYLESEKVYRRAYGPNHPETIQVQTMLHNQMFDSVRRQRERLAPGTA